MCAINKSDWVSESVVEDRNYDPGTVSEGGGVGTKTTWKGATWLAS